MAVGGRVGGSAGGARVRGGGPIGPSFQDDDTYRDQGQVLFIDLRDRYGETQVVVAPESGAQVQELARSIRNEFVVKVTGKIGRRPEGTINTKLDTGEIEVRVTSLEVLNKSLTPPFQPG